MKKITTITATLIALTLGTAVIANAENSTKPQPRAGGMPPLRQEIKNEKAEFRKDVLKPTKEQIKNKIEEGKDRIESERAKIASTSPEGRKDIRENIKNIREEVKTGVKETRMELKEKRKEFQTELKKKIETATRKKIENNLNAMSENLSKIGDLNTKIENRLAKLTTDGKDVTAPRTALGLAKDAWQAAKSSIENARTYLDSVIASTDKTGDINQIKEYLKTAEEKLKTSREATNKVVVELRKLTPPITPNANNSSTTPRE
jgi:chromosome segregation ATPase